VAGWRHQPYPGWRSPSRSSNADPAAHYSYALGGDMSTEAVQLRHGESLELPVEELLRRARPLPPHDAWSSSTSVRRRAALSSPPWRGEHPDRYEPVIVGRPASICFPTAPRPV
jgi:hypothetical protein